MTMHTTWNLKKYFDYDTKEKQDAAIASMKERTKEFVDKWKENNKYLKEPEVLAEALADYEDWIEQCMNAGELGYYAWLRLQLDSTDGEVKSLFAQIEDLSTGLSNDVQFFPLRIATIDPDLHEKFFTHEKLQPYKHWLERQFVTAKYQLSEAEEKILSLKSTSSYSRWVQLTEERLSQEKRDVVNAEGQKEEKVFNDIMGLLSDKNKAVRDSAAEAVNEILETYAPIAEAEINAVFYDKKVTDELRGFARPDQSRHVADDFESDVIDAMLEAVQSHFSVAQEYYQFKATLMGQEKLAYHERSVPYGDMKDDYPFDDASALVHDVLHFVDTEFGEIYEKFLEHGNIDVYPKAGKSGGAFCVYWTKNQPVFVLLNHTNKLGDVLTIAHEMGHAINDELMRNKQNTLNFATSTGTAEVASTFMEDFVLEKLMAEADDETRLALYMKRLNDDISSIHRQVACYLFEQALHEKIREAGYLSYDEIGNVFQENMAAYMGPGVEQPESAKNWWVYWSHIRRFFYVYSYASGLLISKSMQQMVREDKSNIEKVKAFLATGTSASPKQLFADMGIDVTKPEFWSKGLGQISELLEETKELAERLGKV